MSDRREGEDKLSAGSIVLNPEKYKSRVPSTLLPNKPGHQSHPRLVTCPLR